MLGLRFVAAATWCAALMTFSARAHGDTEHEIVLYVVTPGTPDNAGCNAPCSKDTILVSFEFEKAILRKQWLSAAESFEGGFTMKEGGNVFRAVFNLPGDVDPHELGKLIKANITNLSDNAWYLHKVYAITGEKELYVGDVSGYIENEEGSEHPKTVSVSMDTSHGLMYYTLTAKTSSKESWAPCEKTCSISNLTHTLYGAQRTTAAMPLRPALIETADQFIAAPELAVMEGDVEKIGDTYSITRWISDHPLGEFILGVSLDNPTDNGWLVDSVDVRHMGMNYFASNTKSLVIQNDPAEGKVNPTLKLDLGTPAVIGGYEMTIVTSDQFSNAGCDDGCTPSDISVTLVGESGSTGTFSLGECKHSGGIGKGQTISGVVPSIAFHRVDVETFDIGKPDKIKIRNPSGNGWYVAEVTVTNVATKEYFTGTVNKWLGHTYPEEADVTLASASSPPTTPEPTKQPTGTPTTSSTHTARGMNTRTQRGSR